MQLFFDRCVLTLAISLRGAKRIQQLSSSLKMQEINHTSKARQQHATSQRINSTQSSSVECTSSSNNSNAANSEKPELESTAKNGNLNLLRANGADKSTKTQDCTLAGGPRESRNHQSSVESCVGDSRFVSGCSKCEYCTDYELLERPCKYCIDL